MTNIQFIKNQTQLTEKAIDNTLSLLSEGCTIPFIARYRKDRTGNLDEVAIEKIAKAQADYENICKRKETILSSVEEQGKLTEELRKRIEASYELTELEDLYLPYKKKRKTKGDVAKENGLEPLAKQLMSQRVADIEQLALRYLSDKVATVEDALQGASDIIAEWINENMYVRRTLRRVFQRKAQLCTEVAKGKQVLNIDGKDYLLEKPLRADFALIGATIADEKGNLYFAATTRNFNTIMATAADIVIASTELIVPIGGIQPEHVAVPYIFVDYLVGGGK